jgi:hypothetical protein
MVVNLLFKCQDYFQFSGGEMYLVLKTLVTALLVVGISECGKRLSLIGGVLASLPLTSILAFIWLYQDTKDIAKVAELSTIIFWMVIPSLFFFLCLPWFLKLGWRFYPSLASSVVLMASVYYLYVLVLKKFGVIL